MINQLENLCRKYNQTHQNQLTIENYKGSYRLSNQLMPHISVPLSVFETSTDLENTFLTSDSPYHCINAFYTAKADVSLDELNSTIEALREKTKNVL